MTVTCGEATNGMGATLATGSTWIGSPITRCVQQQRQSSPESEDVDFSSVGEWDRMHESGEHWAQKTISVPASNRIATAIDLTRRERAKATVIDLSVRPELVELCLGAGLTPRVAPRLSIEG